MSGKGRLFMGWGLDLFFFILSIFFQTFIREASLVIVYPPGQKRGQENFRRDLGGGEKFRRVLEEREKFQRDLGGGARKNCFVAKSIM